MSVRHLGGRESISKIFVCVSWYSVLFSYNYVKHDILVFELSTKTIINIVIVTTAPPGMNKNYEKDLVYWTNTRNPFSFTKEREGGRRRTIIG